MENLVANHNIDNLIESRKLRMEVFQEMLRQLEKEGKCRYLYHRLALALFGDSLES